MSTAFTSWTYLVRVHWLLCLSFAHDPRTANFLICKIPIYLGTPAAFSTHRALLLGYQVDTKQFSELLSIGPTDGAVFGEWNMGTSQEQGRPEKVSFPRLASVF
jgi:hypothetical protein